MKSNINIVIEKNRKKVKEINVAVENMQFANYKQILLKAQKETSDILAQLVEDERAAYEGDGRFKIWQMLVVIIFFNFNRLLTRRYQLWG